ncbi:MAG TPA: GGDEF domain-containing protein, partial [Actinoplanes sp.]
KAAGHAPRLLGAASAILALTALLALRNAVEHNAWYTGGCGAGYLLGAGLVMMAGRAKSSRLDLASADRHFAGGWAILPYIPIILAVLATATKLLRHESLSTELVWVLLATFSLVLLRQFLTVAIVGRLAVTLERQQAALAHQAHHDSLTGLRNRAAFNDLGAEMLAGQDGSTVLLLDLDGFMPVNDRLGHAAGDAVLITVATRLNAAVRPGDLLARLGGDEFALVLGAPATEEAGLRLADRILTALAEPMDVEDEQISVSGSIGLATGRESLGALLHQADVAMYAAKAAGKGACRAYRTEAPIAAPATSSSMRT